MHVRCPWRPLHVAEVKRGTVFPHTIDTLEEAWIYQKVIHIFETTNISFLPRVCSQAGPVATLTAEH